ncbi:protein LTO1 homolog isoform X4 [Lynx rufus]|uniref:protein LTO1 homolog isoform X4 n=1 Tax=Lynx rufus TaxID=61384 RepID=UPI001F1244D0|nr:protein LTO1 homolog isoform X4 [Lynx rufus]
MEPKLGPSSGLDSADGEMFSVRSDRADCCTRTPGPLALCGYCGSYRLKFCGSPGSGKSAGAIVPTASAHSTSPRHTSIGCYQGFAFAWRCLLHSCATEKDSKKMKALESLIGMIQKFPYDDPTYDKLHEDLDRIRGKFKQLCSLLNVQPDFKISAEGSGLSF